ncbi:glycosyltransferase family 2 protein [Phenylobacterium sp. J367]|uniref:glycosyltransferase family 2 protein n=1 Tax=Phenylobacterium sp. J367 TaxID=2898435 RepID=UPI002151E762|nr:glycosyltransferase family 2 protein [Phenylobacterium sp. J367]MCR5880883.1 glycosyltransferase [Phenylobacterium sp. J367]
MTRPRVSVVTANYNGARHLAEAVRSVLGQTLADLELIIVDDRSTDDSLAVIEAAAAGDPRVRVLVQPQNGGPGAARNRALDAVRGEWIAIFDSDDLMAPDRLERLVARAEADGADIVADNLMVFQDGRDEPGTPFLSGRDWQASRPITLAEYVDCARMYGRKPGLGYLKPLFRSRRLSDVRYREALRIGEDYDLVVRLLAGGARMAFEPAALYRYRKHGASISHVMRREHLLQMVAADAALEGVMMGQAKDVRRAFAARRRSLHAALAYDHVVERLKARDLLGGIAASVASPDVWPLLTLPVKARLKRLAAKLAPAQQPATA